MVVFFTGPLAFVIPRVDCKDAQTRHTISDRGTRAIGLEYTWRNVIESSDMNIFSTVFSQLRGIRWRLCRNTLVPQKHGVYKESAATESNHARLTADRCYPLWALKALPCRSRRPRPRHLATQNGAPSGVNPASGSGVRASRD